jgi:hypothetical protein
LIDGVDVAAVVVGVVVGFAGGEIYDQMHLYFFHNFLKIYYFIFYLIFNYLIFLFYYLIINKLFNI